MQHLLIIVLRVICLLIGLFFIYASLFLYENEQGKLQSIIEDLWIKIDDRQQAFLSRHTMFMRVIANSTSNIFNKLFGKKLFSLRAICVSASFSLASFWFVLMIGSILKRREFDVTIFFLISFIIHLILGLLPLLIKKRLLLKLWSVVAVFFDFFFWLSFFLFFYYSRTEIAFDRIIIPDDLFVNLYTYREISSLLGLEIAVGSGIICDFIFIVIMRKLLQWSSGLESFYKIAAIILLNCCLAFLLIVFPLWLSDWLNDAAFMNTINNPLLSADSIRLLSDLVAETAVSNFFTALTATMFFILTLIMLLHRVFWPLLERPVYALQRLGVVRRSKLLGTLGLILLSIAIGIIPAWLKEIVGALNL